ncbi:unnamed protein product [Rhodiola kirilowii]
MDPREGQNITRPPLLEGNRYGHWRVRMKAFLKSLDHTVWKAFEKGWTLPVTTEADGKVVLTIEDKRTEDNDKLKQEMLSNECNICSRRWKEFQDDIKLRDY